MLSNARSNYVWNIKALVHAGMIPDLGHLALAQRPHAARVRGHARRRARGRDAARARVQRGWPLTDVSRKSVTMFGVQ